MSEAPPRILQQRYYIRQPLGKGGMGAVYLAEDLRLGSRLVAVKENLNDQPDAQSQFKREALVLSHLHHPNLPQVNDYFIEPDGRQYLVMEYVAGDNLQQIVKRQGAFPVEEALVIFEQVLQAVHYLHAWHDPESGQLRPIIHRDIKPANIKRRAGGQVTLAKVGAGSSTAVSARAMTPGYAPIEQYGGGTDARSDIYSLGATLFSLLTGHTPPSATDMATGRKPSAVQMLGKSLPVRCAKVIDKAMQVQASDRYPSIAAMYQALFDRPLVSEPGGAAASLGKPPGAASASGKPTTHPPAAGRSRPGLWPGLLLGGGTLLLGGAVWLLLGSTTTEEVSIAGSGAEQTITASVDATTVDFEAAAPMPEVIDALDTTPATASDGVGEMKVTDSPFALPETPISAEVATATTVLSTEISAAEEAAATATLVPLTATPLAAIEPVPDKVAASAPALGSSATEIDVLTDTTNVLPETEDAVNSQLEAAANTVSDAGNSIVPTTSPASGASAQPGTAALATSTPLPRASPTPTATVMPTRIPTPRPLAGTPTDVINDAGNSILPTSSPIIRASAQPGPTALATSTPLPRASATPTWTFTPKPPTETPTETSGPSNTESQGTSSAATSGGPTSVTLLSPASGHTGNGTVTFSWEPNQPLAPGQVFEPVYWKASGETYDNGRSWTSASVNTSSSFNIGMLVPDSYKWGVWLGAFENGKFSRSRFLGTEHMFTVTGESGGNSSGSSSDGDTGGGVNERP
jgi:hypothetical protein